MKLTIFCAFVASFGLLAGTVSAAERVLLDGQAGQVNEHIITVGEVMQVMQNTELRLRQRLAGDELQAKLKEAYRDTVNMLMEKYLILDSVDETQVRVPDWFVERRANEIIKDVFDNDKAELMKVLAGDRQTYAEWRDQIREHILMSSLRAKTVEQNVQISPVRLRKEYEKNKEQYRKPGQVRIRTISIPVEQTTNTDGTAVAESQVKTIVGRLEGGEDFGKVAGEVSKGAHVEKGGDWGFLSPSVLKKELADEVDRLKAGEFSRQPVRAGDELYIVKVEEKQESTVPSFEEVQQEIERGLARVEADRIYQAWIERLKKKSYYKIFEVEHLFK